MAASKNPLVRLAHVVDEITQLTAALQGATYETFAANYLLRRTTEHAVLIISEAVKALGPAFTDGYPGVDWRAVRDIGNVLRHDYFEVDTRVLWRVYTEGLPPLRMAIAAMIADQQASG